MTSRIVMSYTHGVHNGSEEASIEDEKVRERERETEVEGAMN